MVFFMDIRVNIDILQLHKPTFGVEFGIYENNQQIGKIDGSVDIIMFPSDCNFDITYKQDKISLEQMTQHDFMEFYTVSEENKKINTLYSLFSENCQGYVINATEKAGIMRTTECIVIKTNNNLIKAYIVSDKDRGIYLLLYNDKRKLIGYIRKLRKTYKGLYNFNIRIQSYDIATAAISACMYMYNKLFYKVTDGYLEDEHIETFITKDKYLLALLNKEKGHIL